MTPREFHGEANNFIVSPMLFIDTQYLLRRLTILIGSLSDE